MLFPYYHLGKTKAVTKRSRNSPLPERTTEAFAPLKGCLKDSISKVASEPIPENSTRIPD